MFPLPPVLRRTRDLLLETASQWMAERAPRMAAALAFYTIFSLAPLLIIVVAIAGLAFGQEAAQGRIVGQIEGLIGDAGARAVEEVIENAQKPTAGVLATLVGIATLLFGATAVFSELQDSLNTIWNVEAKPKRGLRGILLGRFVSFAMVIGIGFLLLVSLVISAGLSALAEVTGRLLPLLLPTLHFLDALVSFLGVTALFALLYKFVPDVEIEWREVLPGAAVTSVLFTAGKLVLGAYLGRSSFASTYGAAGSLIVVLLWVYYSAQILFFGAELTQVYATSRRPVRPSEEAGERRHPQKLAGATSRS